MLRDRGYTVSDQSHNQTLEDFKNDHAGKSREALNMLLSKLSTKGANYKMLYADVSRAYFYAKAIRPVYVKLAPEDCLPGEEGMCGRLNVSMYGARDAAVSWHTHYKENLIGLGFQQGSASP